MDQDVIGEETDQKCTCGHGRETHQDGHGKCHAEGGECPCLRFQDATVRNDVVGHG